jgi:hypothetical protein
MKYDMQNRTAYIKVDMKQANDGSGDVLIQTSMMGTMEDLAILFSRMLQKYPITEPLLEVALKLYREDKKI